MNTRIKTTAAALALALTVTTVGAVATTTQAEAKNGRNGAFAAGAALGLLGGALLAGPRHHGGHYQPVKVCEWRSRREHNGYRWVRIRYKACWYE